MIDAYNVLNVIRRYLLVLLIIYFKLKVCSFPNLAVLLTEQELSNYANQIEPPNKLTVHYLKTRRL